MPRQNKPSGGRRVSQTCMIRGREAEGRKAILKRGRKHTRVAEIYDGLTTDANDKVLTSDVMDIQPADMRVAGPVGPVAAIVGERGTITLPAEIRRRHRMQPGSAFLIEERGDEIVLRPAEIIPRRSQTLDVLLARVTAENIHREIDTAPAVGQELS
jgi:AbrB family looped-hinge helix DNA binding protein